MQQVTVLLICIRLVLAGRAGQKQIEGILKRKVGNFQLTGGRHANMKEVNGGKLCVDAFGKEPPGYFFTGKISLDDCAKIAEQQPAVLGFQWGSAGFHHDTYNAYANPEMVHSKAESDDVDLHRLFGGNEQFTCGVFVKLVGFSRQPAPFHESNLTASLGIEDPKPSDGPAQMICFQRWTLLEFVKPHIEDLWFCYMPSSGVDLCNQGADLFYLQGKIFVGVFIGFLAMLGFIMRDLPEFEIPLVWFARFLIHMELGLVCVAFFIKFTPTLGVSTICLLAYISNIASGILLFVPYWVAEWIDEDSPFNTAYLLALAFSPAFLCEFMTYYPGFITLVSHFPLLIGTLAMLTSQSVAYYFETRSLVEDIEMVTTRATDYVTYRLVPQNDTEENQKH